VQFWPRATAGGLSRRGRRCNFGRELRLAGSAFVNGGATWPRATAGRLSLRGRFRRTGLWQVFERG
jgi:hypothetical protein